MLYERVAREQQTLTLEAYGEGGPGSWLLLDGEPSAAPITSFKDGKYLVGDSWLRASELVHHRASDLEAARRAAVDSQQAAEDDAARRELAIGEHALGSRVWVKGVAAAGAGWFQAEIIAHRKRYPPIQIKYVADYGGDRSALVLPAPLIAFVPLAQVLGDKPSPPPKRQRNR